jgi:PHD/YefM family antitoxin component YafN of YafNO toxin-antitoxin module
MITIKKKVVVDEQGQPQEVIISWQQYQEISDMLGLDLDEESIADLHQARRDRATHNWDAYVTLDALDG